MELLAPRHLLVILLVALLVFGTQKLRTIGPDLGAAIRGFKKAMNEDEAGTTAAGAVVPSRDGNDKTSGA